jgi:hypothetical protein
MTQTSAVQKWPRPLMLVLVAGLLVAPLAMPPARAASGGVPDRLTALEAQVASLSAQVTALDTTVVSQTVRIYYLETRVAALQRTLAPFSTTGDAASGYDVTLTKANLHIVNGLGATNGNPSDPESIDETQVNGRGNLILGYNEDPFGTRLRTGSHTLVIGLGHEYTSFGGMVVGYTNSISMPYSVISAGASNVADALFASVSGGTGNWATGQSASVSGGFLNYANGTNSSVSGGYSHTAPGDYDWVAGALFQDE